MVPPPAQPGGIAVYLIPMVFIGLAMLRGSRARNLRIERLWITPAIILVIGGLVTFGEFARLGSPPPLLIAIDVAALVAGAALGWWRGRFTIITVDQQTHMLTSRTSPVGMLVLLGIFAVRFGLRGLAAQNASALHVSVAGITDAFLLLAVGLICAQRLEIALRASRLLISARATLPAA